MKGLVIITRKEKLDAVKKVLLELNEGGITVTNVCGCGHHLGQQDTESLRVLPGARVEVMLLSKVRIETVVQDEDVDRVIDAVCEAAHTGKHGDGKIFIYDIIDAVRIRTRERGPSAV